MVKLPAFALLAVYGFCLSIAYIARRRHSYIESTDSLILRVRLSHTWVITARLTHSYMYAGYRLGGGGGGGGEGGGSHSHLYTTSVRLTHT